MDAFTHGLASYAVTRAIFPRATQVTMACAILAGMGVDVDGFSRYSSAATYLHWHRTYLHSLGGMVGIAIVFFAIALLVEYGRARKDAAALILLATVVAGALHLAMDLAQNETVELLWPLRARGYSADWVAHFDPWITLVLLAGLLMPQLLALVTEEIGAKSKGPRGRIAAILALAAVCGYLGARAILHGNAVGMMESRTYRGDMPRRVGAFAESNSLLRWHGIVETERAIDDVQLDLAAAASFNPDAGVVSYKPEPSPALDAAGKTESVRRFLAVARFPRASIEKTTTGFRVQIRDVAPPREEGQSGKRVMAVVETDPNARVVSDELMWSKF